MSRLAGISGNQIRAVAESLGWVYERTTGDHMVLSKSGRHGNLSIPAHREVKPGMLRRNIRDMGISVDEFMTRVKR